MEKEDVVSEDRISDLPWEILDNILCRLPLKTSVSTAILSPKWRDKWTNLSKLVFDNASIDPHSTDSAKLARIINSVLLFHCGTIQAFVFTTQSPFCGVDMDIWLSLLRKSGVKKLTFDFSSSYTPPPCLFSFDGLKHLSLASFSLAIPKKFTVFEGLVSLELKGYLVPASAVQDVINNCPNLEKLVLSEICLECLYIYVPNLKYFHMEGEFKGIDLLNSPHLTDAVFKMTTEATAQQLSSYKVQLPAWISSNQRLALSGYFLRYLAARCKWRGINIPSDKVEGIELDGLHFDHLEEISLAFSILIFSSSLKELHIRGSGPINKDFNEFTEGLAQLSSSFIQLRVVKIEITRYEETDEIRGSFLDMVNLVLAHSSVLEKINVHYTHSEKSDLWFVNQLMQSKRASSKLKIEYTSTHFPFRVPAARQVWNRDGDDNNVDWSLGVNYGYW